VRVFCVALLFCLPALLFAAGRSEAASVYNPGPFKATIPTGSLKIGTQSFQLGGSDDNPSVTGTIDASGNINVPAAGVYFPKATLPDPPLTVAIRAVDAWTGSLDPLSGTVSLSGSLRVQLTGSASGVDLGNSCYIGAASGNNVVRIQLTTGTVPANPPAGSLTGSPYEESSGKFTVVNNTFAVPTTGNSGASCGPLGLGNSSVDSALGLPTPSGQNEAKLDFTVAPKILAPIRANFTTSPSSGKAPLDVTFDGSSSKAQRNAGPISAYKWDWNNDGTVDETTTTPIAHHVFTDPGNYDIKLTVVGGGANPPQDSVVKSVTVTGAIVNLTEKPDKFTSDTSAHFEFTNSEGTDFQCKVDAAADWSDCESPLDLDGLTQGQHTLQVRGLDEEGSPGLPTVYTWTVDTTAPIPAITGAPPAKVNGSSNEADITFSGSDNFTAPGDLAFECRYDSTDDGDWGSCSSPKHVTWNNQEGIHTFEVRATDQAGNTSTVAIRSWTVDLTAPNTSLTGKPINILNGQPATTSNPTNQTGTANGAFSFGSDEPANGSFVCKLNDGPERPCSSPIQLGTGTQTGPSQDRLGDPVQGNNTFKVWAVDEAGNRDPNGQSYQFAFDNVAPTVTLPQGFLPPTRTQNGSFNVAAVASEPTANIANRFECSVANTASYSPCTDVINSTTARYQQINLPTNTQYVIRIRATDPAGNVSTGSQIGSFAFAVDTTAPVATISNINDGPLAGSVTNDTSAKFTFTGTDAFPTGENPTIRYECRVDTDAFANCGTGATVTKTVNNLANGSHQFDVRPIDQSGNVGAIVSRSWTVGAASVDITAKPVRYAQATSSTFTFAVANGFSQPGDTVTYQCRNKNGTPFNDINASWASCTTPRTFTATNNAQNWFEVRAVVNGTPQFPAVYTWYIDGTAPTASISSGPGAAVSGQGNKTAAGVSSGTVNWTMSDSQSGLDTTECRYSANNVDINTVAWAPCTAASNQQVSWDAVDGNSQTFQIRATDLSGRQTTTTRTWVVDAVAPIISAGWGGPAITGQTGKQASANRFGYISNETASATYQCSWNGADPVSCPNSGNATLTIPSSVNPGQNISQSMPTAQTGSGCVTELLGLCISGPRLGDPIEGVNTLKITPIDGAGNVGQPITRSFTFDTTPPTITRGDDQPAEFRTNQSDVTIHYKSNEPVARYECSTNGTTWTTCNGSAADATTGTQTLTNQTEGSHSLLVRGVDKSTPANTSAQSRIAEFTFVVDKTNPITEIKDGPGDGETVANSTPDFTFAAVNETAGVSEFECRVDGGTPPDPVDDPGDEEDPPPVEGQWEPCGDAEADDPATKTLDELEDGPHTFEVRAIDEAGNTGDKVERSFSVDTTGPEVEFTKTPSELTNVTNAGFEFEADEENSTFACSLDNGDFEDCESPLSLTDLDAGDHSLIVSGTDALGNIGPDAVYEWSIDTRAPKTTIDSGPTGAVSSASAQFEFSADENGTTFECKLDGGNWGGCSSPKSVSGLTSGDHTFAVRSTDAAGNTGTADAREWKVDLVAPHVQITAGPSGTVTDRSATFDFQSDEANTTFTCSLDGGAFTLCSGPISWPDLPLGEHTFTVRGNDAARNVGEASRTWTIAAPAEAPVLTLARKAKVSKSGTATLGTLECKQPGGCHITSNSAVLLIDGEEFTVKFTVPATIGEGANVPVKLKLKGKAKKAFKSSGKAKLTNIAFEVASDNGMRVSGRKSIKLKLAG
jgi:hypothetical protein